MYIWVEAGAKGWYWDRHRVRAEKAKNQVGLDTAAIRARKQQKESQTDGITWMMMSVKESWCLRQRCFHRCRVLPEMET